MNRLATKLKYRFRNSSLAAPYWNRRHAKMQARGLFSQYGEDLAILEMFPQGSTYLDIGANHPFLISTTYMLYNKGWRGVTVEPIRSLCNMHRKWRPHDICLNAAVGEGERLTLFELVPDVLSTMSANDAKKIEDMGKGVIVDSYDVPVVSGRQIVADHFLEKHVDIVSIDVEAYELPVLQSFDFGTFRPSAIIIEEGSFVPNEQSVTKCVSFLKDVGYRHERTVGCNGIYVT